jgi:hypothetical protein
MTMCLRRQLAVLFLAVVAVPALVTAQRQPRMPTGFRSVPDESQIVTALQGRDIDEERYALMVKAAELPPGSLRDSTIRSIGNEVLRLQREIDAQFVADPTSRKEGDLDGAYMNALVEVLKNQKNPAAVDALVAMVPFVGTAESVVELGEAAVPALVSRARRPEASHEVGYINGALATLEQMLESPQIRPTLSASSRRQMRQVATDRMKDTGRPETAGSTFAHAAYLAVATGDPQLRKQVADIVNSDVELLRHGISVDRQPYYKKVLGEALAKRFEN